MTLSCCESLSVRCPPEQIQQRWKKAIAEAQVGTLAAYQQLKEILSKSPGCVGLGNTRTAGRFADGSCGRTKQRMYLAAGKAGPRQRFAGEGKGGMHKRIKQSPSRRFGIRVTPV